MFHIHFISYTSEKLLEEWSYLLHRQRAESRRRVEFLSDVDPVFLRYED